MEEPQLDSEIEEFLNEQAGRLGSTLDGLHDYEVLKNLAPDNKHAAQKLATCRVAEEVKDGFAGEYADLVVQAVTGFKEAAPTCLLAFGLDAGAERAMRAGLFYAFARGVEYERENG